MLNLVIDIGNTRTKIGLFEGNILQEQANAPRYTLQEISDWGSKFKVQAIVLSSVTQPDPELLLGLKKDFKVLELNHQTPLPFENAYETPQTLGKDRLAGVAGAQQLFPNQNCLVVDCGTCIKYDLILAEGRYLGGNIAPGAAMRLQAMHHFTARLPLATQHLPENPIGFSTETALQNGALRGAVLEIEGFARLFAQKIRPLQVLLSGGDADLFYPAISIPDIQMAPNLTLIGLNAILLFNLKS